MNVNLSRTSSRQLLRFISVSRTITRGYAIQTPGAPTVEVFNNRTKWLQKERAASNVELSRQVDYLRDEVASRLCERLLVRFCPWVAGVLLT
jgi:NADH dehydrogenase [ubiquinone] 1 alpha subcomplex assembly factor 5